VRHVYQLHIQRVFGASHGRWRRAALAGLVATTLLVACYVVVFLMPGLEHFTYLLTGFSAAIVVSAGFTAVAANLWANAVVRALFQRIEHERALARFEGADTMSEDMVVVGLEDGGRWKRPWRPSPASEASAAGLSLREFVGDPVLFGRECDACGYAHAPVLCGRCGTLQYGHLEPDALADVLPRWRWPVGVFVSHFRWEISTATVPALVAGLIALDTAAITASREEARVERAAYRESVDSFINATISFRAALASYEAKCGDKLDTQLCQDLFLSFSTNYMQFSWYGERAIYLLRAENCDAPEREETKIACRVFEEGSPIEDVDRQFRTYSALLNGASEEYGDRRVAALNLYEQSRLVQCAVAQLEWAGDWVGTDWDRGCVGLMRDGWMPRVTLPPCDPRVASGTWACWRSVEDESE
jgi:hypothetical protein